MLLMECLAALGCALLLWSFFGWILRPPAAGETYLITLARGSGQDLEQSLRSQRFLRKTGWLRAPTLLVDAGLDAEGQKLAALLEAPDVILLGPQALEAYLELERRDDGRKTSAQRDRSDGGLSK